MSKIESILEITLFKKLFKFIKPYNHVFVGVLVAVVLLAVFGAVRPYILQQAIDQNIVTKKFEGFLPYIYIMAGLLLAEVVCQLLFIYYSGFLGQSVVKDIRVKLFDHMIRFRSEERRVGKECRSRWWRYQ